MITSAINNNYGPGKSTVLYALVKYILENEDVESKLYSYSENNIFIKDDDINSIHKILNNADEILGMPSKETIIEEVIKENQNFNTLNFVDSKGTLNNQFNPLYLYSRNIIIPITPTDYYLENALNLIRLIEYLYKNDYKTKGITENVKKKPGLVIVQYIDKFNDSEKDKIIELYGHDFEKVNIIENVFPRLNYRSLYNQKYLSSQTKDICIEIYNTLFSL